jgi:hypothetical protein
MMSQITALPRRCYGVLPYQVSYEAKLDRGDFNDGGKPEGVGTSEQLVIN